VTEPAVPEAFDRYEYAARVAAVRRRMEELALDALLVTAPENILYLCGYQTKAVFTFQFLLLHRSGVMHLVTREMEKVNAALAASRGVLGDYTLYRDDQDPMEVATAAVLQVCGSQGRVGIELASWTMSAQRYRDFSQACKSLEWVDASELVDRMRLVKSPAELRVIREAATMTDRIASRACGAVAPGLSEKDLARIILDGLVESGSEYPGSWPNVLVGRRTGLIHGAWGDETVAKDDLVTMEVTGVRERYHAPSMSTIIVGTPDSAVERTAVAMREAHAAAVRAMAPGRPAGVIDQAARAVLARHHCAASFARRSGYSFGIGFPPSWGAQWQLGLTSGLDVPLEIGMTFHVVLVAHFADGRAMALGRTVALLETGAECWTDGRIIAA
jgi:Xaa-Pro dipeptidase